MDCNLTFPFDLAPNGIPFRANRFIFGVDEAMYGHGFPKDIIYRKLSCLSLFFREKKLSKENEATREEKETKLTKVWVFFYKSEYISILLL